MCVFVCVLGSEPTISHIRSMLSAIRVQNTCRLFFFSSNSFLCSIYVYMFILYIERANESLWVLTLGEGELGLSALGGTARTRVCRLLWEDRRMLHHEAASGALSLHCQSLTQAGTRRPRTYPASFCPLLIPCVHLHTRLRSFTVCRAFTLGSVHYSGFDNYVTKIWCICCLTTCLGVGCFYIFILRENFWKNYFAKKKSKQGKTFGVCQLLRADSKCEIEKQEYFNYFCNCIGLKLNIH